MGFDERSLTRQNTHSAISREASMTTLDAICELAVTNFGSDASQLDLDAPIQQLGADSLGFLEFLFELEGRLTL